MNKIKIFLILAVIASTVLFASAFTSQNELPAGRASMGMVDPLYWYDPSSGSLVYDDFLVREDEIDHSGCPDAGQLPCRKGYSSDQLNNPANPSLGVKSGQIGSPQDIIYKVVP